MDYAKLYNPDDKEFFFVVNGVEVRIPSRQAIVVSGEIALEVQNAASAIEVVGASEADFKAQEKALEPPKKLGKAKKGAK